VRVWTSANVPEPISVYALQVDEGKSVTSLPVRISDYEPHQSRVVVELWRASFEHGVGIKDHHPIDEQHAHFVEQVVPVNRVRVALDGPAVVAFMASTPESISQLYVRVAHIGQGIGSVLVELAKSESVGSLWLYTFARNAIARRFYERHGFVETGRESGNMWKLEAIRYCWERDPLAATLPVRPTSA
jgi:GNAT superfamily N-acetyltransferase